MRVFISYSSKDHDFVLLLAEKLRKDLIDVWIADWELKAGDSIVEKINQGLEKSSFLIIIFSEHSIKSDWVLRELNSALMRQLTKKDIKILPILLEAEPEELPPLLSDIYSIKFPRDVLNETQYQKLIAPIREKVKSDELAKYQDIYFDNIMHVDMILNKEQPTKYEVEFILKLMEEEHYRNYFFKKVTALHWFPVLKKEGFFKPSEKTRPQEAKEKGLFSIPVWNVLFYLDAVSQTANLPDNEKYISELLSIIEDVSTYKDTKGERIDNYRTWYYFVKMLLNLPNEKITEEVINFIPIWLDSKFDTGVPGSEITTKLLPKFLTDNPEDIRKAEKIIESITAIRTYPLSEERARILGKKKEEKLAVDPYWLKEAFDKFSQVIAEKCSRRVIEDLASKVKSLLKKEENGSYESFYEEPDYSINDPLRILTFILKGILLAKAKSDVNTTKGILRKFLKDKYLFFPKMAIYIIGQSIDNYSPLFWEILESKIGAIIFKNTLYFGDELKNLLKNLKPLSSEQREVLNIRIEQGVNRHTPKKDTKKFLALFKQEIYEALSHDSYFKDLYEEMKKITKVDTALHPAIGKVRTRSGPGPAPLTKEEILRMTNIELTEFLSKFKTKDFWEGPTVGGLSDILREAVKTDPNKFIDDLIPFENAGFIYIYRILDGFRDAWKEKKAIDWGKIFDFVSTYIQRQQFWDDEYIVEQGEWLGGADHNWITGITAELIEESTRDDSWAFSEDYFDKARRIIFYLLREPEEDKDVSNYVTYTLNTPCGKLISSLVNLALRIARVNDKKGIKTERRWSEEYRNKFNDILSKKIIEAYVSLGRFLPNLYYLDKNWVVEKIEQISTEKGSKYWEAFVDGYFSIGRVYDELYVLMKPHCQYGLSYNFRDKRNQEHLMQHVCIGYLRDHEKLDDSNSLFRKIIDSWKPDQIKGIIGFFWMQRDIITERSEENEKMREKITEFWRQLYKKYKRKDEKSLTQEDKKILSEASKLTVILPQIDPESYEWLMLSAPYVHEHFNSSFFIQSLDELKNKGDSTKSAKYIGEIYLKMLEKITPDFDKKRIRPIIEFLYSASAQEDANKICNIYGSRGYEFLRDIYEKHSRSA
jgi:hypothetical protein